MTAIIKEIVGTVHITKHGVKPPKKLLPLLGANLAFCQHSDYKIVLYCVFEHITTSLTYMATMFPKIICL